MGTFHQDKGELHGITVVVDTSGEKVYIGRCDVLNDQGIVLHDVDVHSEGENDLTNEQYVARAAQVGAWKKLDRIAIPKGEIASVRRLGEILKE